MNAPKTEAEYEARMHLYLNELDANIEKHGWAAQGVFPTENDPGVPWIYTIGYRPGVELCVVGLGTSTGHSVLSSAVEAGVDAPGEYSNVLAGGYMVQVRAVDPRTDEYSFSIAARWRKRHGNPEPWGFVALQILWPDVAHRFPGNDHYDKEAFAQPLIEAAP